MSAMEERYGREGVFISGNDGVVCIRLPDNNKFYIKNYYSKLLQNDQKQVEIGGNTKFEGFSSFKHV